MSRWRLPTHRVCIAPGCLRRARPQAIDHLKKARTELDQAKLSLFFRIGDTGPSRYVRVYPFIATSQGTYTAHRIQNRLSDQGPAAMPTGEGLIDDELPDLHSQ